MRVVLAEDSSGMRSVMRTMLKAIGVTEILEARHGAEAWDLVRSQDPDLLLTDWVMPVMDGIDLLERVRVTPGLEKLPTIVFTSRNEREDVIRALKAGADGFLTKPFGKAQLKAKVDYVLRRRPSRRIERVLTGTDELERGDTHPLVIIGESAVTAERLGRPDNREILDFLVAATDALHFVNARSTDLHIGYILEASTSDVPKRMRSYRRRVKMVILDSDMGPGALTLARLLSINRPADLSIFLVCESESEFEAKVRFALERTEVTIVERYRLDTDAMEQLYAEFIVARQHEEVPEVEAEMLTPEEIAKRMEGDLRNMVNLPVLPQVYQKIVELDKDPESELEDWIQAIEADPLTRAQVIRRARSPLYGFRGEIDETSKAVILLGKKPVKEIVISGAVKRSFDKIEEAGFSVEQYWLHSIAVAIVADILAFPLDQSAWTPDQRKQFEDFAFQEDALQTLRQAGLWSTIGLDAKHDPFVAGVMHDIGRVAMAVGYPGLFSMMVQEETERQWATPLRAAEETLAGGADHTVAGGILADSWKLGGEIQEVIREHHAERGGSPFADLTAIADFIGGGIYPFPTQADFPTKGLFATDGPAVDDALKDRLKPFLSEFILPRYNLRLDSLIDLGRAVEPTVRKLVENIRSST